MRNNARIRALLRALRRPVRKAQRQAFFTRRFVVTALLRIPLIGGVAATGQRAAAARRQPHGDSHVALTIAAVIDHMLPGDELPGARALGIDRRIAAMTDRELKRSFTGGVAWLDARARAAGRLDFLALDDAGKETALQAALVSGTDGVGTFVRELRSLAFTQYYTDPTVMAAFKYSGPPQPAGFPDFQEAPR